MKDPNGLRMPLALMLMMLLSAGCFSYVPTDLSGVTPGQPVKVELSRGGMSRLLLAGDDLTSRAGPLLLGTLSRREGDEILVRVPMTAREHGPPRAGLGQDVRIPAGEVVRIGGRQFNWFGTGMVVGAAAGLAAVLIRHIMSGADAGEIPVFQEPDNSRRPLPLEFGR